MIYDKETIDTFYNFSSGMNFTITTIVKDGDKEVISTATRKNQPCYGELRRYKRTHKDTCTAPENKPGDLHSPYPKGETIQITAAYNSNEWKEDDKKFLVFLLEESPFSRGIVDPQIVGVSNSRFYVSVGGDSNPNVVVNLFKNMYSWVGYDIGKKWEQAVEKGLTKDEALFMIMFMSSNFLSTLYVGSCGYTNTTHPDIDMFFGRKEIPYNLLTHDGATFREGGNYSRVYMHGLWEWGLDGREEVHKKDKYMTIAQFSLKEFPSKEAIKNPLKAFHDILSGYQKYLADAEVGKAEQKPSRKRQVVAMDMGAKPTPMPTPPGVQNVQPTL